MSIQEIAAIRAMFTQNAMNLSTAELRVAYDNLGGAFSVAADIELRAETACGAPAEWGASPNADTRRVLLYPCLAKQEAR